ncbi:MAG: FMN-binding protein [Treponema sp.]|nr:FMN-binding protein [Candidatus Treponema equi]
MSNKNSSLEMIKLGLVLALFAAASCTVLALVNSVTSVKIAENKIAKANAAMKVVMADADGFEPVDFAPSTNSSIKILSVYKAVKGGTTIGAVAQINGPTYDRGTVMVGMKADGTISGVQFLELSDSPGFGLKANDPTFKLPNGKTFYGQFEGKNAKDGFKAGETFDAISGATITSVAVAALLEQGTESMLKYFEGGAK